MPELPPPPPRPPPLTPLRRFRHTRLWHAEVFWTCTTHALSTEREEVMGLLLGDILVRRHTHPLEITCCIPHESKLPLGQHLPCIVTAVR